MTNCEWYYGETGTGNNDKALENYSPEAHYVAPNDNGWRDGYKGRHTVILNDLSGQTP